MSDTIHVEEAECPHRLPDGKPCHWTTPLGPELVVRIREHIDAVHPQDRRRITPTREYLRRRQTCRHEVAGSRE